MPSWPTARRDWCFCAWIDVWWENTVYIIIFCLFAACWSPIGCCCSACFCWKGCPGWKRRERWQRNWRRFAGKVEQSKENVNAARCCIRKRVVPCSTVSCECEWIPTETNFTSQCVCWNKWSIQYAGNNHKCISASMLCLKSRYELLLPFWIHEGLLHADLVCQVAINSSSSPNWRSANCCYMHRHHCTATKAGVLAPLMKSKTWREEDTDQVEGHGRSWSSEPCPPWPNFCFVRRWGEGRRG